MTLTVSKEPPTRHDAMEAAHALARAGVSEVLLYGSLARGDQHSDSDIDLVAIFEDLDYRTREQLCTKLTATAEKAAGRPADIRVTDWPEWTVRSRKLTTSIERRIADHAITLFTNGPPTNINWEKDIGLPDTDQTEATRSLNNTVDALHQTHTNLHPSPFEDAARSDGDDDSYLFAISSRLRAVCSHAHIVLETSLKALIHLYGNTPPPRTHRLGDLETRLPQPIRTQTRQHLETLNLEQVSLWRQKGTYAADYPDITLPDLVPITYNLITSATRLAGFSADQIRQTNPDPQSQATADRTTTLTQRIHPIIKNWDLTRTTPTDQMNLPPPPRSYEYNPHDT